MAQYKITESGVSDTDNGLFIPGAAGNRHWSAYKLWKAEPNTPDPSITEDQFIENKKTQAAVTFENTIKSGFTTTAGIKWDATLQDLLNLKAAYDFAILLSLASVDVRDFDSGVHTLTPPDLLTEIIELGTNLQTQLNIKWNAQATADNSGYGAFVAADLVAHDAIVAAN